MRPRCAPCSACHPESHSSAPAARGPARVAAWARVASCHGPSARHGARRCSPALRSGGSTVPSRRSASPCLGAWLAPVTHRSFRRLGPFQTRPSPRHRVPPARHACWVCRPGTPVRVPARCYVHCQRVGHVGQRLASCGGADTEVAAVLKGASEPHASLSRLCHAPGVPRHAPDSSRPTSTGRRRACVSVPRGSLAAGG